MKPMVIVTTLKIMTKGSEKTDVSDLNEKVKASVERLKAFAPPDGSPYYLAFSGGKDSVVTKAIAQLAGVPFQAVYRVTSVDPPELVRFIKKQHPDVIREVPHYKSGQLEGKAITMWNLITLKLMPPTRLARYCCEFLKEDGGDGGIAVTGVRWAESVNRKLNQGAVVIKGDFREDENPDQETMFDESDDFKVNPRHGSLILTNDNADNRRLVEHCFRRRKVTVNPIIEWTDADVWEFIRTENIPYCELYDEGHKRLGCIGCPMGSTEGRYRDFARWPKYFDAYMRAFASMIERRKERNKLHPEKPIWRANTQDVMNPTADEVMVWWLETDVETYEEFKRERGETNAANEH